MTAELAFFAQVTEKIDRYGWMITGVFPVDDDGHHFVYTVGLTEHGSPELCMTGVPPEIYQAVLNEFAREARNGRRYEHGETVEHEISGGYKFTVVNGPAADETVWPSVANRLYGEHNVRLQQLVWPDQQHRLPWDDGYDGPPQPVIGKP